MVDRYRSNPDLMEDPKHPPPGALESFVNLHIDSAFNFVTSIPSGNVDTVFFHLVFCA